MNFQNPFYGLLISRHSFDGRFKSYFFLCDVKKGFV